MHECVCACVCLYVCVLQLCSHTDLLNFCNSVSGGHCLVAGGTQWVTKVSICLLPHFLFRPTGTEGGGKKGGGGLMWREGRERRWNRGITERLMETR